MERNLLEEKIIFHVDMDAFFVSVEESLNPSLKGKPVVVGGDPAGRGVVSSASYAAREHGIHSGMPAAEAKRLCPRAIFLRGSMCVYLERSNRVMEILERFTPVLEKVSIDEAYLDLTGCKRVHKADPVTIAHRIHNAMETELGLTVSIGIGSNKLISKIAANSAKPNGIMMILSGYEADFLAPLPIERMPGVGPATKKEYLKMGIRVIGDLLRFSPITLKRAFGKQGTMMASYARGDVLSLKSISKASKDLRGWGRGVNHAKSISREITYSTDLGEPESIEAGLSYLAESVGRKVRKSGLMFFRVNLKLRYADFVTHTRSRVFTVPSNDIKLIYSSAVDLFYQLFTKRSKVRLIGVGVSTVHPVSQLDLFRRDKATDAIAKSMDALRDRYGFDSVMTARSHLHSSWKSFKA
ncbi:MAG TPA: DNA polymerase IV [Nitrospinota bacterium]|nr:DNA polymerase IV [Nitrospinota bacterium]|tara:strand:- start:81905 stop:83140 length:1236 start_codon:yes stop_codon:yes gene_type:complete